VTINSKELYPDLCCRSAHREVAESVGEVNNYMKKVKEMEHELARIRGVHPVKDVSHLKSLRKKAKFSCPANHCISS
jgi:hypothetical protein